MALQERKTVSVVLTPEAKAARIKDLINKASCWEGHIRIAQTRGDLRQIRFGEARLIEIERQMDVKDQSTGSCQSIALHSDRL